MGQTLYRKYRSHSWDEIVGQEHITIALKNTVKTNTFSHAYLFSGPRGVGKTSVARILAHEINQIPYTNDSFHIDIIEIDAASNTSVEDIRNLREKVAIQPTLAKYKVYIIDEVHMLSKSAFNALLKTLEEPPKHVVFILATTDPQKLPATVISRTQHFVFRPISNQQVTEQLSIIAKKEGIEVDPDALQLIAEIGDGSFRDSISLLDQLSATEDKITRETIETMIGLPSQMALREIIVAINNGNPEKVIAILNDLRLNGKQSSYITSGLANYYQTDSINNLSTNSLRIAKKLVAVNGEYDPEKLLEIVLIEETLKNTEGDQTKKTLDQANTQKENIHVLPQKTSRTSSVVKPVVDQLDNPAQPNKDYPKIWNEALNRIHENHYSLYALARMAQPHLTDNTLVLSFEHSFHVKRVKEPKNFSVIAQIVQDLFGESTNLEVNLNDRLDDSTKGNSNSSATNSELRPSNLDTITKINDIFGNSELLEAN